MANPFDQFDAAPAASQAPNPFDKFDDSNASSSATGAFARGAEAGTLPAAGAITGAGAAAAAVQPALVPLAAMTGPAAPFVEGAGTLLAGAAGAVGGGAIVGKAQQWVLDHAPDSVVKALGLDQAQQAADEAQHPDARFAGELAPNLAAFRPGAMADAAEAGGKTLLQKITSNPITARATPAAIMAGQEAANEEVNDGKIDPAKIGIAATVGALSNKPTTIGAFLHGAGAGPVLGLQAALRNRGMPPAGPDFDNMRDITPDQPGPAPAGTPQIAAPIDPQDVQPGDAESPIPTSYIAAGRKAIREATTPIDQAPENNDILARNGWPQAGTPVTLADGEGPPVSGTVKGGFNFAVPDAGGATADGLHVTLDTGDMFTAFKHEIDAAGISITPQLAQQAGLPLDITNQPAPAPTPEQPAPPPAVTPPVTGGMPADLFVPRVGSQPDLPVASSAPTPAAAPAPPAPLTVSPAAPIPAGDATATAPIDVTHPDHLLAAEAAVNTAPTPAQIDAGNYAKGHITVQGLPISIENPAGSVRSGVGADGQPWSAKMPATYGYIKRTNGADGEQVDAYVGPNPTSPKVFVIDQKDAQTGVFDEHKAMIGFDTKDQALATYHQAFSDGLGPQRVQGVREMNTVQFKNLLNSGTLDKPVTKTALPPVVPEPAVAQTVIKKTARQLPPANTEMSALTYIKHLGGIKTQDASGAPTKEGQDIRASVQDVNRPGLINNKDGMTPDRIRENMKEAGWFGQNPDAGNDMQDLYDLMDKEIRNGPQYHPESERGAAIATKAEAESSERARADALDEITHYSKEYREIFSDADKETMLAQVAAGMDPESAVAKHVERKAMREHYEDPAETADPIYSAAFEPDHPGTGATDRSVGDGVEGSAPVAAEASDSGKAGDATPADSGEAHPEPNAEVAPPESTSRPRFHRRADAPTFFSALTRTVEGVQMDKAAPGQWEATIKNLPGVKAEELDWSGINDWLRAQAKPVTKAEVLAHLRENEVRVQEVEHGSGRGNARVSESDSNAATRWIGSQKGLSDEQRQSLITHVVLGDSGRGESVNAMKVAGMPEHLLAPFREAAEKNNNTVKFPTYTLPGGENYRELLLTLPEKAPELPEGYTVKPLQDGYAVFDKTGDEVAWAPTRGGALANAAPSLKRAGKSSPTFRSSHFDEPNILAHVRFDDRTGPNGEKILHMAEVQSDWHQKGRKSGYALPEARRAQLDARRPELEKIGGDLKGEGKEITPEIKTEWADVMNELQPHNVGKVPDAPFKSSWHELALKRMLRYAAEHGYDRLSWDRGDTNAARYDLSKQVDDILYRKEKDGRYYIGARKDGKRAFEDTVAPEKLPDIVGKDVADKIIKGDGEDFAVGGVAGGKRLSGLDLKVGGEGMKGFYDKILPAAANKIGKKFGAKVESDTISSPGEHPWKYEGPNATREQVQDTFHASLERGQVWESPITGERQEYQVNRVANTQALKNILGAMKDGATFADAMADHGSADIAKLFGGEMAHAEPQTNSVAAHSIPITDAMRESVMQGQPLFAHRAFDTEPGSAIDGKGNAVPQTIIPGAGGDAVQLAAAREAAGKGKSTTNVAQKKPGGMFGEEPKEPEQGALFHRRGAETGPADGGTETPYPGVRLSFSPKFAEQRAALADALREHLDRMGLKEFGVKVADTIAYSGNGYNAKAMDGYYADKVITFALDSKDPYIVDHEMIHGLRDLGFFSKDEWAILEREAKAKWLDQFADKLKDYSDDERLEESVAFAHQEWARGRSPRFSIIARIFQRLRDALHSIREAFTGRGFQTADDIFSGVESGKVGRRGPNVDGSGEGPRFAQRAAEASDDHEEAWNAIITSTAKRLGWEGEPTSRAMFAKALLTPKGQAKTDLTRSAGLIKSLEDQRAAPFRPGMTPIPGTGERKTSGLAQGIEDKATRTGTSATFEGKPEYDTMNKADQIARATRFDAQDRDAATAVAMGTEPPPFGLTPEAVLIAVENRAIREGDAALLRQIGTKSALMGDATTMGQRISMLSERDPTSPVAAIKSIQAAREGAAQARGADAPKAKKDVVKEMVDAANKEAKASAKKMKWETFIQSIKCAE